ncbi:hypothetical protein C8Q77DRAFT_1160720 [Trametes polyzona]|nr:hypothetical protein C8Q77DRAFT_1160720 [Trametes polyzona]
MPASGNTHKLAKRGVSLDPPLIAGIVVVVVLLNLVLALSWFVLRSHQRRRTHKRRTSAPIDCEKYENSAALAALTGAVPRNAPGQAGAAGAAERKSYFELIQALQREPEVPSSARLSCGSSQSSVDSTRLSDYILRPQDIKELSGVPRYPKAKGRVQALRRSAVVVASDRVALTRSNSLAETASVYSSASAPMDHHEQLLRTQPFAIIPGAPGNEHTGVYPLPKPPPPAAVPRTRHAVQDPRESPSPLPAVQTSDTRRRPSHPDVPSTPTISPASSQSPMSPGFRIRANSNTHASAPHVQWLPSRERLTPRPSKTDSISSLSMILSLHQASQRPSATEASTAPLNIRPRFRDEQEVLASPSPPEAGPTVPVRSPRRRAHAPTTVPSGSGFVEGSESP